MLSVSLGLIWAAVTILIITQYSKKKQRIEEVMSPKIRNRFSKRKIKTQISLLVPYTSNESTREVNWEVLKRFWQQNLPDAEMIIEGDNTTPFCKTAAVNRAFRKSRGDVVVILDADGLINPNVILQCADNIRTARDAGYPLWYIPYRQFYRLTQEATDILRLMMRIENSFEDDQSGVNDLFYWLGNPPEDWMREQVKSSSSAHYFGALMQIMPREAFEVAGGMDEHFIGWGGEDVSFMNAVDTMYGKHRTFNSPVYHMWHASQSNSWGTRLWEGQKTHNGQLTQRYEAARGDRHRMAKLIGRL